MIEASVIADNASAILRGAKKVLMERHLADFVKFAWPIVEPSTPLIWNWHIDLICEYLEEVTDGNIQDLIINMPPRHMKSNLVSVFWPCWIWIGEAAKRMIFSSYAQELSTRDSVKVRRILTSPEFQSLWGDKVKLVGDQNVKTRFENTATGYRMATSVGGSVTGEGGDILVVDDPHNIKEIHSDLKRKSVIEWWDNVMSTRRNDPERSARVIIMQRGHQLDLSGHVLKRDDYTLLCIQSVAESKETIVFPRSGRTLDRREGALLWPKRFGESAIKDARRELGSYGFASQHQQRPTPVGGGIIKRAWWQYYKELPKETGRTIQSWDTAFKAGEENDYTVGGTWVEADKGFYLIDVWRKRVEFPDLKRGMIAQYDKHRPNRVIVEDKASGQSVIQSMKRETKIPIKAIGVDSDKVSRVHAISPAIEAGRVFLPERAPWLADFLDEFESFPNGSHDDQVDMTSQALASMLRLTKKNVARPRITRL